MVWAPEDIGQCLEVRGDAAVTFCVEARGAAAYFTRPRTFSLYQELSAPSICSAEVEKTLVRGVFPTTVT